MPDDVVYSKKYQKQLLSSAYIKMKAILNYDGNPTGTLKTPTLLIRPTEQVLPITEDYGLSKVIIIQNKYIVIKLIYNNIKFFLSLVF